MKWIEEWDEVEKARIAKPAPRSRTQERQDTAFNPEGVQPPLSAHALLRCGQRRLAPDDVSYVVDRGHFVRGVDADYIFLRRIDVPEHERNTHMRLSGTALVLSKDGVIITVWRNQRNGLRNIRSKVSSPHF